MEEIKYIEDVNKYSQAYSSGVKMTAVSKDNEQIKPFFFCADYFNEIFGAVFTNSEKTMFGFTFDPSVDVHPAPDSLRVLITSDSHKLIDKINEAQKFLNGFENEIGLRPSTLSPCSKHPQYKNNVILADADNRIKNTPLLLTAWRVMLRNSFATNLEDDFQTSLSKFISRDLKILGHGDENSIPKVKSFIDYVKNKDPEFIDYFDIKNYEVIVDFVHNYSGLTQFDNVLKKRYLINAPWEKRITSKIKIS
jgi:hypothetical protein